jgi:hypothetical protein
VVLDRRRNGLRGRVSDLERSRLGGLAQRLAGLQIAGKSRADGRVRAHAGVPEVPAAARSDAFVTVRAHLAGNDLLEIPAPAGRRLIDPAVRAACKRYEGAGAVEDPWFAVALVDCEPPNCDDPVHEIPAAICAGVGPVRSVQTGSWLGRVNRNQPLFILACVAVPLAAARQSTPESSGRTSQYTLPDSYGRPWARQIGGAVRALEPAWLRQQASRHSRRAAQRAGFVDPVAVQSPPSADTSDTLPTRRLRSTASADCSLLSRVVCDVMTLL